MTAFDTSSTTPGRIIKKKRLFCKSCTETAHWELLKTSKNGKPEDYGVHVNVLTHFEDYEGLKLDRSCLPNTGFIINKNLTNVSTCFNRQNINTLIGKN